MKNHEFTTISADDGTSIDLYVAFPEGAGNFPSLIVLQEAFGVNHHIRNICERLCQQGYAVAAPDLFHRTVKRLEAGYDEFPAVMPHYQALTTQGLTLDLKATYNWLQNQEQVNKANSGAIGFCLGGKVSFLANTVLPLKAAISYYGGGVEELAYQSPDLHGAHLFYWGGLDQHISLDKIKTITSAVSAAGKNFTTVTISDADHGFNCDERPSYNDNAAKEAWAHSLSFFTQQAKRLRILHRWFLTFCARLFNLYKVGLH